MQRIKMPHLPLTQSYLQLPKHAYAKCAPQPVRAPKLIIYNTALAQSLSIELNACDDAAKAQLFSGNALPQGCKPIAQAYAGHQFGHFAMLGDGRAHLLGEHTLKDGSTRDIQLKGSGRTPFSRSGDGRAALGPMLREYLMCEAMHALGVPTTRALAVVASGEPVFRQTTHHGAILTRVASSHLRVGSFEYFAAQRDVDGLKQLADYTIARHYPELAEHETPYLGLLKAVMKRQALLITEWLRVGFVHGVMNTDNMSISGESIDYGPCAFMDAYNPATVFSSIDEFGRYAFANQPSIAQWNLTRFAESLLPLINSELQRAIELAEETLEGFDPLFQIQWLFMMRRKLGLLGEDANDETLIKDWLQYLQRRQMDYTNSFRALMDGSLALDGPDIQGWHSRWQTRRSADAAASQALMHAANPVIIPRNHQVEAALSAAEEGDLAPFHALTEQLQTPYENTPDKASYTSAPPAHTPPYQTFCGT